MLRTVGPYRLTRELRSDVLTTVHEGVKGKGADEQKVTVILGKMPARVPPEDLELFKVEAEATAGLGDDHADPVIDHGMQHGMPYVVHPYRTSWSLGQQLEAQGKPKVDASAVAVLGADVARALAEAHAVTPPLLHRGISVHTILVDDLAHARITGYGLAAITTQAARKMPALAGLALRDCAPEVVEGKGLGPGADLFGLGAVLVTLLRGSMPAAGGTSLADKPASEVFDGVDLPAALSDTIVRLLKADPAQRGRAEDVIDGLAGCFDDAVRARHLLADSLGVEATTLKGEKRGAPLAKGPAPVAAAPLDSVTKETRLPDALAALAPSRPAPSRPAPSRPAPTRPAPTRPAPPAPSRPAPSGGPIRPSPAVAPSARAAPSASPALAGGPPPSAASPSPPAAQLPVDAISVSMESSGGSTDTFDDDPPTVLQTTLRDDDTQQHRLDGEAEEPPPPAERKPVDEFFEGPTIVQRDLNPVAPPTSVPMERTEQIATMDEAILPPTERTVQLSIANMPEREAGGYTRHPTLPIEAPTPSLSPSVPEFGPPPNPIKEWIEAQSKTVVGGWPLPWLVALGMAAVFFVVIAAVLGIVLAS